MFLKEIKFLEKCIENDVQLFDIASLPLKGEIKHFNLLFKSAFVVLSGIEIIKKLLLKFDIESDFYFNNSDIINNDIKKNIKIATLKGDAYNILITERITLNIFSLMSSIATKTYEFNKMINDENSSIKIACTRKTMPGLANFQKVAVMHGNGDMHRLNLYDAIMIKDNHIALYGSVKNAIEKVSKYKSFTKKIEVEVESEEDAFEALKYGADIIMLDNFKPIIAKNIAKKIKKKKPETIIEVSGGINKNTLLNYCDSNIDIISIGALTTEIKYIDFSLEL